MKFQMLFNEAGAAGAGEGGGAGAATTASATGGSYLGADAGAGASTTTQQSAATTAPTYFFREDHAKDGTFNEGWSTKLEEAGFKRLAAKAMTAKDEGSLLKMLDDTIGHASGRKLTRPTEGADVQQIADWRAVVGAPQEATAYEFLKEGLPEGASRDDFLAGEVEAVLHKYHVPAEVGKELSALYLKQLNGMQGKGQQVMAQKIADREASTTEALRKEWGEDFDHINGQTKDFLKAMGVNFEDEMTRYALMDPAIAKIVNEARIAWKEPTIPGANNQAFTGSASLRQKAQEIMKTPGWRKNPDNVRLVNQYYAADSNEKKRRAGAA